MYLSTLKIDLPKLESVCVLIEFFLKILKGICLKSLKWKCPICSLCVSKGTKCFCPNWKMSNGHGYKWSVGAAMFLIWTYSFFSSNHIGQCLCFFVLIFLSWFFTLIFLQIKCKFKKKVSCSQTLKHDPETMFAFSY